MDGNECWHRSATPTVPCVLIAAAMANGFSARKTSLPDAHWEWLQLLHRWPVSTYTSKLLNQAFCSSRKVPLTCWGGGCWSVLCHVLQRSACQYLFKDDQENIWYSKHDSNLNKDDLPPPPNVSSHLSCHHYFMQYIIKWHSRHCTGNQKNTSHPFSGEMTLINKALQSHKTDLTACCDQCTRSNLHWL